MSEPMMQPGKFTIATNRSLNEKDFVKEAARQAREYFRRRKGGVVSKGGRPSLSARIEAECGKIWNDWGERFPRNQSMQNLVEAVSRRIPGKRNDLTTIKRNVQKWIQCNLSLDQVPDGWIRTPDGKRLLRMQLVFATIGQALEAQGSGASRRTLPAPRKGKFASVVKTALNSLNSVSDKELACRFIVARRLAGKQ
ncbi:MAG TPA: hypothetical protein PKD12_01250 [Nitrospira sp.]|nr:hypothetical protein [Nitrospira sp.]